MAKPRLSCNEMVADEKLNLLDFNICPADISSEVQSQIRGNCRKIHVPNSAGLLPLNYSLIKTKVWVNETAPRLHNSGHQTKETHNSQFEQFYRV